MNQPYPGWQQPYGQQPYGQQHYGQPPGYPPPGYGPPPGHGPQPGFGPPGPPGTQRPNPAMARTAAALFLPITVFTALLALLALTDALSAGLYGHTVVAALGMQFISDPDGVERILEWNIAIPLVAAAFAGALFGRIAFARWVLVGIGGVASAYYVFAVGKLLVNGAPGEYIGTLIGALVLWAAPTVIAALPATGRALRRPVPPGMPGHWG